MEGFVAAALRLLRCRESAPEVGRELVQQRLGRAGGEARFFTFPRSSTKVSLRALSPTGAAAVISAEIHPWSLSAIHILVPFV